MKYFVIDIYGKFQCTGSDCPDTCCAGWGVQVDSKTAEKYRELSGEFGQKLRDNLEERDGQSFFKMPGAKCAFLTEEHLCEVYQEIGPENMCTVCKTYPRITNIYGDIAFSTLTLSCPEAVRLLMEHEEKVQFDFAEDEKLLVKEDETDWKRFNILVNGLTLSIGLLQDTRISFPARIRLLLLLQMELQTCIEQEKEIDALKILFSEPEHYLPLAQKMEAVERKELEKLRSFLRFMNVVKETHFLEIFYDAISDFAEHFSGDFDQSDFTELFAKVNTPEDETWYENYCVYYLVRHYMLAYWTKKPLEAIQELVWMLNLQQCTMMTKLLYQNGKITKEQQIQIVCRLSRMFEHSSENLNKVRKDLLGEHTSDVSYWLSMV